MRGKVASGDNDRKLTWGLCVLGFLCVAIVGLGVGILVINLSRNNNEEPYVEITFDDDYDRASVESNCTDRDEYNGIMLCIENDYNFRNHDLDKAISRYKNVIREKTERGEYGLAMQLFMAMVYFNFSETEDCGSVLRMIDEQDLANVPDSDRLHFYSEAEALAYECDNSDKQLQYKELYDEIRRRTSSETVNGGEQQ